MRSGGSSPDGIPNLYTDANMRAIVVTVIINTVPPFCLGWGSSWGSLSHNFNSVIAEYQPLSITQQCD